MLQQTAYVDRAEVGASGLDPLSPEYVRQSKPLPALVQPLRGDLAATVAGKLPEATHVVYLEAGPKIIPGDLLTVELLNGKLVEAADIGVSTVSVTEETWGPGDTVEIGEEVMLERFVVEGAEDHVLELDGALEMYHPAGERVAAVRQYEALAVEDEGGQGHHLRVVVRG
jgi:hypothetical protein